MATISPLGTTTFNTTAGNKTVTATPAVNDLIVVIAAYSDTAQDTVTITDNNSSGTYTEIQHAFDVNVDRAVSIHVRDALIASASSTIFTMTITGDTGGGLQVFKVTGMTRTGASAVRQSNKQTPGTAGATPTITLGGVALTGNPVVGGVANASSPAGITQRSSPAYSEGVDTGYATPTTGLETMYISSGETASSIAWGGTSATAYSAALLELDSSAPPTVINVDTPGSSTWAGQTVGLTTVVGAVSGAITLAGATDITLVIGGAGTVINVDVPGAVTLAGQGVGLTTAIGITAGAVTWTGQTIGLKTTITPTAGALQWAGQTAELKAIVALVAGAITWAGATDITLVATGGVVINVDVPGATTWSGSQLGLKFGVAIIPGAITWAGQQVSLVHSIIPVAGSITFAGQTAGLRLAVAPIAGAIIWTGSAVATSGGNDGLLARGPHVYAKMLVGEDNAIAVLPVPSP